MRRKVFGTRGCVGLELSVVHIVSARVGLPASASRTDPNDKTVNGGNDALNKFWWEAGAGNYCHSRCSSILCQRWWTKCTLAHVGSSFTKTHDLGKGGCHERFCMWTLHHWAGDRRPRLGEVAEIVTGILLFVALLAFLRRVDKSSALTISTPCRYVSHPLQCRPDSGGGVRDRGKHRLS